MTRWVIEGVGIPAEEVLPYLDKRKVARVLQELLPADKRISEIIDEERYENLELFIESLYDDGVVHLQDYFYCALDGGLGYMLKCCDETETLVSAPDESGLEYLYYPPSMSWERSENEPESLEEVHYRIVMAVQKLADMTEAEIETLIDDDLYESCSVE